MGLKVKLSNGNPFERCLESVRLNAESKGHDPYNTVRGYMTALKNYMAFVNSEKGLEEPVTWEYLIEEAREDVRYAQVRIRKYFIWLQGDNASEDEREEVEDYEPWTYKSGKPRKNKRTSAAARAFGSVRGFYTHNGIDFGKWSTPKISDMIKDTIENDRDFPIFTYEPENNEYTLNYSELKRYMDLLSLRDKSILLGLLSTGLDSGDLLKLTLGWLRSQSERERLSWRGIRQKTKIAFWTFVSREATESIRHYVDVERKLAPDNERIFYTRRNDGGKGKPLTPTQFAARLAHAAQKMGIYPDGSTQNPFRAKRMRHIFQTACRRAGIPLDRMHTFVGHVGGIEMQYLERNLAEHESFYTRVEPFVMIYSPRHHEIIGEVSKKVEYLSKRNSELEDSLEKLKTERTAEIEELRDQLQKQALMIKDLERERENFTDDMANKLVGRLFEMIITRVEERKKK